MARNKKLEGIVSEASKKAGIFMGKCTHHAHGAVTDTTPPLYLLSLGWNIFWLGIKKGWVMANTLPVSTFFKKFGGVKTLPQVEETEAPLEVAAEPESYSS